VFSYYHSSIGDRPSESVHFSLNLAWSPVLGKTFSWHHTLVAYTHPHTFSLAEGLRPGILMGGLGIGALSGDITTDEGDDRRWIYG